MRDFRITVQPDARQGVLGCIAMLDHKSHGYMVKGFYSIVVRTSLTPKILSGIGEVLSVQELIVKEFN